MFKAFLLLLLISDCTLILGQENPLNIDSCGTFLYFTKSQSELSKYIDDPCSSDSLCTSEIEIAKRKVKSGTIAVCMPMSLGTNDLRQETQIRELCRINKLSFEFELFSCIVNQGQTPGCYGLYMDKIIAEKFGINFKQDLLKMADSLLVASNPTVYYSRCDTLPRLPNKEDIFESTEMEVSINSQLFKQLKPNTYGYYPGVDIGFYIDTMGIPTGYFISQFFVYEIESNRKFKNELCKIAINHVKQYKLWKPGIINGRKVKTEYNVRISFTSKTSSK
ncbi:MAG: hypothetical protein ABIN67_17675 [Ferruginibacter sp.]